MSFDETSLTGISLFEDDVDIDDIPDNPNELPEDTYYCTITDAKLQVAGNKQSVGLIVTYKISEGPYAGENSFPFSEWLTVRAIDDDPIKKARAQSKLKKRCVAWGFGVDILKSLKPEAIIGATCMVKTRNQKDDKNPDFIRVKVTYVSAVEDYEGDGTTLVEGGSIFDASNPPI